MNTPLSTGLRLAIKLENENALLYGGTHPALKEAAAYLRALDVSQEVLVMREPTGVELATLAKMAGFQIQGKNIAAWGDVTPQLFNLVKFLKEQMR